MATTEGRPPEGGGAPVARGWRAPEINAVARYAASIAPVGGRGISVSATGAGRVIELAGEGPDAPQAVWEPRPKLYPGPWWALCVRTGLVLDADSGAALDWAGYGAGPDPALGLEAAGGWPEATELDPEAQDSPLDAGGTLYGVAACTVEGCDFLLVALAADGAGWCLAWGERPAAFDSRGRLAAVAVARLPGWAGTESGAPPPRILPLGCAPSLGGRGGQWRVAAAPAGEGRWTVTCGAGLLAWGGGHNVAWPADGGALPGDGAEHEIGEIAETAWVVWSTKSPPCPTTHDTRWPLGDGPAAHATGTVGGEEVSLESDITTLEGDPDSFSADAGEVTLESPGYERPDGVTDWRLLAVVTVEDGAARVEQVHSETIEVHAIVRPGEEDDTEESGDEEKEDAPECGNPLNGAGGGGKKDNPLDGGGAMGGGAGGGGGKNKNPLDYEGDGGFSPDCKDGGATA